MASKLSDFSNALEKVKEELNVEKQKAEEIARLVVEEAKSKEGNPEKLISSIKNGARNVLTDIGLETVSWVENPSQDSMFVMMKDSEDRVKKHTNIYKAPEKNDWSIVYGPVMRPNDIDKGGGR